MLLFYYKATHIEICLSCLNIQSLRASELQMPRLIPIDSDDHLFIYLFIYSFPARVFMMMRKYSINGIK